MLLIIINLFLLLLIQNWFTVDCSLTWLKASDMLVGGGGGAQNATSFAVLNHICLFIL
jgi:hypothetical protein